MGLSMMSDQRTSLPSPLHAQLLASADTLLEALIYDDSGHAGRGGNGGLISRDTIRKADALRQAISMARKQAKEESNG